MKRHMRDNYFISREGIYAGEPSQNGEQGSVQQGYTTAELRKFRFSRIGPENKMPLGEKLLKAVAEAMVAKPVTPDSGVPAGYTFLAQFIAHDLTWDKTAASFAENVTVAELNQGRSPALDLDSLYGRGPRDAEDARFYSDEVHLKVGTTAAVRDEIRVLRLSDEPKGLSELEEVEISPAKGQLDLTKFDLDGFDLPRVELGSTKSERRKALIPDPRNDENLGVAQTHLAFTRFHNRMVDQLAGKYSSAAQLYEAARNSVVKHYQWMLWNDFLPLIVKKQTLNDVFANGRKYFEKCPPPGSRATVPVEFAIAAGRFGHSMVGPAYQWNRIYCTRAMHPAWLQTLFNHSGMSGTLSPRGNPEDLETGEFERLPTNAILDRRRLYDFGELGLGRDLKARREDLEVPDNEFSFAKRIDTLLTDSLRQLPVGSFFGHAAEPHQRNLAFRTLARAQMVNLASGQQMAEFMNLDPIKPDEVLYGRDGIEGVRLGNLTQEQKDNFSSNTSLWFYILREAELNDGCLGKVGGRIVAEVFHRAMEGSEISILRDPWWRPSLGPDSNTFRMVDLLLFAFEGRTELLNPLGN